jgi:hypothetical protein
MRFRFLGESGDPCFMDERRIRTYLPTYLLTTAFTARGVHTQRISDSTTFIKEFVILLPMKANVEPNMILRTKCA